MITEVFALKVHLETLNGLRESNTLTDENYRRLLCELMAKLTTLKEDIEKDLERIYKLRTKVEDLIDIHDEQSLLKVLGK